MRDAEVCRSPLGSALLLFCQKVGVGPFAKATVGTDLRPTLGTVDSTSDGASRHDMRVRGLLLSETLLGYSAKVESGEE